MAGSLHKRLEVLESHLTAGEEPDWDADDQLEAVLHSAQVNRWGRSVYPATDRELNILAGSHAYHELPGSVGELELPSGAVVILEDAGDGYTDLAVRGTVLPSDLPEGVREYVERMDSKKQPGRERWLYDNRHANRERREWVSYHLSEEQVRARHEEWKRRDREFLERNRARVGLPPLTREQIVEYGLEVTLGEGATT